MNSDRLYAVVVMSLAMIMVAVVIVLLAGLFSSAVDNDKVLPIISHAFDTIVGCFVGILGGKAISKGSS